MDQALYEWQSVGMSTLGQDIEAARIRRDMTQESLAAAARVSKSTVWSIEADEPRNRHAGTIIRLVRALGYETLEELRRDVSARKSISGSEIPEGSVPLFDEVPAGDGDYDPVQVGLDNGLASAFIPTAWLPSTDFQVVYAVVVRGDSMSPRYQDGDIVFVSNDAPFEEGMPAVYRLADGEAGLKYAYEIDEDAVEFRSHNERYPAKRRPRSMVVRIGRVVGSYRKEVV